MLSITITPTRLYFNNLTDELQINIETYVDLKHNSRGFYVEGDEKQLYKILLKLAYTYDIELY